MDARANVEPEVVAAIERADAAILESPTPSETGSFKGSICDYNKTVTRFPGVRVGKPTINGQFESTDGRPGGRRLQDNQVNDAAQSITKELKMAHHYGRPLHCKGAEDGARRRGRER